MVSQDPDGEVVTGMDFLRGSQLQRMLGHSRVRVERWAESSPCSREIRVCFTLACDMTDIQGCAGDPPTATPYYV